MAVPKRRTSKARKHKRRTHFKATMPTWSTCSNCHEPSLPHNICEKCGHYNGKKVVEIKD